MSFEEKLRALRALKEEAALGGGQARIDAQHARGKLTARERIDLLVDPGSFEEIDALAVSMNEGAGESFRGDAVVTGWGTIDGRTICVFAQDFTVYGGSLGEVVGTKIAKTMDLAVKIGVPIIGLNDSGGARIQEGVTALAGYGEIFLRNVRASGVVPQISVILGPCAGGAVYSPAITDFIFMVKGTSQMFITGPDVIEAVTGEKTTQEELGGAMSHNAKSGAAQFSVEGERECLEEVRRMLAFIPSNQMEDPPFVETGDPPARRVDEVANLVPDDEAVPYDVRDVIEQLVDHGDFQGGARVLRAEHRGRLRAHRRLRRRRRRQPADVPGRRARHRLLAQGGALRALLRRLQPAARDARGRAGLPPRPRAGVRAASSPTAPSSCTPTRRRPSPRSP